MSWKNVKIGIWWDCLSGYSAGCWRALANESRVDVRVLSLKSSTSHVAFDESLVSNLPVVITPVERLASAIEHWETDWDCDVLFVSGWARSAYRRAVTSVDKEATKLVLAFDNPWTGKIRQRVGAILLRRYCSYFDAAIVAGERGVRFADRLGFRGRPIFKGLYGIDTEGLERAYEARRTINWPRSFLYVGRFAPEKGIQCLVEAYDIYRKSVTDPWPLTCIGSGPLCSVLSQHPSICVHGFTQPRDMVAHWARSGVFVMPSLYDPWPLAIVEACRSGLPIIHSNACGSAVETVREHYNGKSFAVGDTRALSEAMLYMHSNYEVLSVMGERSVNLADAYSASNWAKHWVAVARQLTT